MTTAKLLAEEFACYGFNDVQQPTLNQVVSFISAHEADAESVVSELVAFASNREASELTDQLVREFKKEFFPKTKSQKDSGNLSPTQPRHELSLKSDQDLNIIAAYGGSPLTPVQPSKRQQTTPDSASHKRRSNITGTPTPVTSKSPLSGYKTPVRNSKRESVTPSSKKYTRRNNKSEVVSSHGETNLVESWQGTRDNLLLRVESSACTENEKYRYMFQKLQDRAYVLDRRIDELSESIVKSHPSLVEDFTSVSEKTTTEVYVKGQICCDCEGKLNTESVLLQGCMHTSGGRAVPVSLTDLSNYSLFPGQTVVLKAHNEDGSRLKAVQCLTPEPLPTPVIEKCGGLTLMVACGPFTPDNTSDYAPLDDLLDEVVKAPPDVLILMGPFVDMDNQVLQHSIKSYEEIFQSTMEAIKEKTANAHSSMQLVIVPSHKDLHHEPVFPTPAYKVDVNFSSKSSHFVMNPCTLTLDGVKIGLSSTDVLFQMAANEISWDASTKDRMLRLSEHLLSQRSYFPVYPPNSDLNLDLELNEKYSSLSSSPHLLLLSSNFNQFIKVGKETVFANPGRLCKGEGGGTYMRMLIKPFNNMSTIKDNFVSEIVRI